MEHCQSSVTYLTKRAVSNCPIVNDCFTDALALAKEELLKLKRPLGGFVGCYPLPHPSGGAGAGEGGVDAPSKAAAAKAVEDRLASTTNLGSHPKASSTNNPASKPKSLNSTASSNSAPISRIQTQDNSHADGRGGGGGGGGAEAARPNSGPTTMSSRDWPKVHRREEDLNR